VRGTNQWICLRCEELSSFISNLSPIQKWDQALHHTALFCIHDSYDDGLEGKILTGLVKSGTILQRDHLLLGPGQSGDFHRVVVKCIHINYEELEALRAGHTGAISVVPLNSVEVRKKFYSILCQNYM